VDCLGLILHIGYNLVKCLLILVASSFVKEQTTIATAGFVVLDDFVDSNSYEGPLEEFRFYEDDFSDVFGQEPIESGLFLNRDDGTSEAVLRYDTTYDYGLIERFIFQDAFLSPGVEATLNVNSYEVAGLEDFDANGFSILTFDLGGPLGTADLISFHFTSTGTDPFSFGSSELHGIADFAAVPEPTSILLVGMTVACGGTYRLVRRRRKASVSVE
jgi:hypothetical protein